MMHCLGLEVDNPAPSKSKNGKQQEGTVHNRCQFCLQENLWNMEVKVDVFAIPTKGESHSMILGRPWIMAMKAKQYWGIGLIKMQGPEGKEILYNMRTRKNQELDLKTSMEEFSNDTTSNFDEESSLSESNDSSIKIMGFVIGDSNKKDAIDD